MTSISRFKPVALFATLFIATWLALSGCGTGGSVLGTTRPKPTAISVTPATATLAPRATQQFTATATYADRTTKDVTSTATWSSTAASVASVNATGLATAAAAGSTMITASSNGVSGGAVLTVSADGATPVNVMPVTVDGSLCSAGSYPNKPCTSVTVCTPGSATACQTVSDIVVDTGSYGLRIFSQALSVSLTQATIGSGSLTECFQFLDSADWGPVKIASVILGGEPAIDVPMQVIDSTFASISGPCTGLNADTSPSQAGFNGILGVGLFTQDCGDGCVSVAKNNMYFACTPSGCTSTTVLLTSQVQDPVALLPQDNNGVIMQLPSVSVGGVPSVDGNLVLGIGTRPNNTPSGVVTFPADQSGEFTTIFNGATMNASFIDSGSNALFFGAYAGLLPVCPGADSSWFCPTSTTTLYATNKGATGSSTGAVEFSIGNAEALFRNLSDNAFIELGGPVAQSYFDWGLPFFFGRSVYIGFDGTGSPLGTGPYWAY